ncbi:aspartate/glutamate racemase family protein [Halovulum sp. GXIMD14794]
MRIAYINPNSTEGMTDAIVATAREALPDAEIFGLTNADGPPAIEGAEDGARAVPGVLSRLDVARVQGAEAIVIACFDDTGLTEAQAKSGLPVLGIGQASYVMASLLGLRFSVVTSLPVSIPVIEVNIRALGYAGHCASIRASGLPVLTIDEGGPEVIARIASEIELARTEDGAAAAVLGCAGMAPLRAALQVTTDIPLIDGVAASAHLARAAAGSRIKG